MLTIENKKYLVEQAIATGMTLFEAGILAELSLEDIEELENDPSMQRYLEFCKLSEEQRLREKFDTAMDVSAERGNTSAIEKKLQWLRPEKYTPTQKNINENTHIQKPIDFSDLTEEEAKKLYEEMIHKE